MPKARFAIIVLPGSNCDHDAVHVTRDVLGEEAELVWHRETKLPDSDCVIIPGGFAYGDYLRAGALAKFAPIMDSIRDYASKGGLVLGICNGFQVLTEIGLLPGAMMRNSHVRFAAREVMIRAETTATPFTNALEKGAPLRMEIAHGEGNYYADDATLDDLEANGQVVFRYCDARGDVTPEANPNGSSRGIAGITNRDGNVLGMMPHPERSSEETLGSADGLGIFRSIVESLVSA